MTKLSIIVPVYNVEQYLRKCVDSLLAQDLPSSEYEIILVDDGSTDDSWQIVQEYVSRFRGLEDERIRGIHQQNAGLSAARNTGIAAAKGEYLMFIDSDDYIEANVLGGLMAQVERENLDVLRYRLQYVKIVESQESRVKSQYQVFQPYKSDPFKGNDYSEIPTDGVTFLNERMNTQCYAWQFILRRDLIYTLHNTHYTSENNTLFTEGIYFEDTDWTPRMLVRAKRVASTETIVYNYLMREGSITNAVNRSKQKKVLDDKMRLVGELQRQSAELASQGLGNRWFRRMIADTVISIFGILSVEFYKERKSYLAQLKQLNVYPIQSSLPKARLINLSPRFAVQLLHLKNA
jgi:glycosyltransferase involved in cell wall biosynthesis